MSVSQVSEDEKHLYYIKHLRIFFYGMYISVAGSIYLWEYRLFGLN